jgi:hypothetical protein
MSDIQQIQKLVQDYFENTDPELFIKVVDVFVYEQGTDDSEVTGLITKFLNDMDISKDHATYFFERDKQNYFKDFTLITFIENIKLAMLNTSHNNARWYFKRNKTKHQSEIDILNATIKADKAAYKYEKTKADYFGDKLEEILTRLNYSESYFYGEKEDKKLLEVIKKFKDENRTNTRTKKTRCNK